MTSAIGYVPSVTCIGRLMQMAAAAGSIVGLISTIAGPIFGYDPNPYIGVTSDRRY